MSAAPATAQGEGVEDTLSTTEVDAANSGDNQGDDSEAAVIPDDGVYFADVLVRGQSVFQVGSLDDMSASQRAAGISRRIASLLDRTEDTVAVSAEPTDDPDVVNIEANGPNLDDCHYARCARLAAAFRYCLQKIGLVG